MPSCACHGVAASAESPGWTAAGLAFPVGVDRIMFKLVVEAHVVHPFKSLELSGGNPDRPTAAPAQQWFVGTGHIRIMSPALGARRWLSPVLIANEQVGAGAASERELLHRPPTTVSRVVRARRQIVRQLTVRLEVASQWLSRRSLTKLTMMGRQHDSQRSWLAGWKPRQAMTFCSPFLPMGLFRCAIRAIQRFVVGLP